MGDRLATIDMGQKLGLCPFFLGVLHGPHVTQCGLVRGLPSYHANSYQVASIQPFGHNKHGPKIGEGGCATWGGAGSASTSFTWPKNWGCAPFSWGRCMVPMLHNVAWFEAYLRAMLIRTKWHPYSRLATTNMGRKLGRGLCHVGRSWVRIYLI